MIAALVAVALALSAVSGCAAVQKVAGIAAHGALKGALSEFGKRSEGQPEWAERLESKVDAIAAALGADYGLAPDGEWIAPGEIDLEGRWRDE